MRSTILFDLDGTLLDTSPGIFESANHTMRAMGFKELPDAQLRKFVGPPLAACFRVACGLEEHLIPTACDIYRAKYAADKAMFKAEPYPGIIELLDMLRARGLSLSIATLKLEPLAITILEHFGLAPYFETVAGADKDGLLTKADIIDIALKRMGVTDRSRALMVGDTPHDQEGARIAGVDFIGVDWGFGFSKGHKDTDESHVLAMIDEPAALLEYV